MGRIRGALVGTGDPLVPRVSRTHLVMRAGIASVGATRTEARSGERLAPRLYRRDQSGLPVAGRRCRFR
jgi:hypothetical protein